MSITRAGSWIYTFSSCLLFINIINLTTDTTVDILKVKVIAELFNSNRTKHGQ